ncbi:MAG TPA: hypothetical protein VK797_02615 [Tepidisphaeraceae bacterium]|jgi:hypothetical protein|nr:hypothetical protein [Tepidisphaeraceae bacterium]
MRLAKQIGVVLGTYLTRPAFVILAIAEVIGLAVTIGDMRWGYHIQFSVIVFLGLALINLLPVVACVMLIIMFLLQVRQQLRGPQAALTPDYRRPHQLVAGTLFLVIVLALTAFYYHAAPGRTPWNYYAVSPSALFVVVLTFMTLAALSAIGSAWWLLVLIPLIWAATTRWKFELLIKLFVQDFRNVPPARFYDRWMALMHRVWLVRAAVLIFDLAALAVLAWRVKPATTESWELRMIRTVFAAFGRRSGSVRAEARVAHEPLTSVLRRANHRRLAVHHPRFAWSVAGFLAVALLLLALLFGRDREHTEVMCCLVMATVIPGAIVAASWRERWPSLAYESLYPAGKDQFISEIAVAVAVDLAEFWLAAFVAALVALAIVAPRLLVSPLVGVGFLASGMMQVPVFGVTLLMSRRQAGVVSAGLMVLVMLAQLVPLLETWSDHPALKPAGLLLVALAEMAFGILLALAGYANWRRAELA